MAVQAEKVLQVAPKLVAIGEVLWDLFPDGARFGGAPANFACHAALLGAQVTLLSAVGHDVYGQQARQILQNYGIDIRFIQTVPHASTGTVEVTLNEAGKPNFQIQTEVAWDQIIWSDDFVSLLQESDAIYFGTLAQRASVSRQTIRQCVEIARAARVMCLVDINLRPPFSDPDIIRESIMSATILKLSDEEIPVVREALGLNLNHSLERQLQELCEVGQLDWVVLTRGAQGAMLVGAKECLTQPGIATRVRDTVGAGDAFTAAFIVGLLQKVPHDQNLRQACTVAAQVCAQSGAVPEPPTSLERNHG